jgi:hypothetical protein
MKTAVVLYGIFIASLWIGAICIIVHFVTKYW